ncbi:phosphate-selective porin OprO and OprP [Solimonas aquatica]|uniref:Phosphate-selective porin OprO and OprP n=1 Tax=Solimonas aquatica TaxID=489703 RepID=A0A1H9LKC8_9GAMM|nr:porin [Solimonas aquatica]SER11850.1 phosphate-selective porin OprO and OprP [Solimonas aquatica]
MSKRHYTWALLPIAAIAGQAFAEQGPSLEQLDQRIKILERQLENQKEEADAKAKDAATVAAGSNGFSIKSAKGDYEFKFRGLLQADGRFFLSDGPAASVRSNDGFLLRRVEPTFELTLGKQLFFRIQPNFAPDSATVSDVYGELRLDPAAVIRAGKFKVPVVLENLQASGATAFNERGFPNELGPNRDYGVQLGGALFGGTTSYALGIFNGASDGRDGAQQAKTAGDNRKEFAGRVFSEPFKNEPGLLQGLGFGVGGTYGTRERGTVGISDLAYRTPGQNTFFSYVSSGSVFTQSHGYEYRVSPQAYYYRNSFGLVAEYIENAQQVITNTGSKADTLHHKAYQGVANYFLTGEDASYGGLTKPKNPLGKDGYGAFELVARYGVLDIDDKTFPTFASATASASKASTWAAGLNWYPVNNLKIDLAYSLTRFDGGAAGTPSTVVVDRQDEKLVYSRFQIWF